MRTTCYLALLSILCLIGPISFVQAESGTEEVTALDIMHKVADRDLGDDVVSQIELIIVNNKQKQRTRTLESFSKKSGEDRLNLMLVSAPQSLLNTGFLSIDYKKDDPEDNQWIYLSALQRTKRIASKDKSGRFLSSDFSYYDLTLLNTDKFTYEILEETTLEDTPVWKIKATALSDKIAKETGYQESVLWVRKDPYIILKADHQTDNPKRRKVFTVESYEKKEGDIWVVAESVMRVYYKEEFEQETTFITKKVQFNQDLSEKLFTVRNLEKGL